MKKVFNYLLLLMLAMLTLNLQSCGDDDDDEDNTAASCLGTWREISSDLFGQSITLDMSDSTQMAYERFDENYCYMARYQYGEWEVSRCPVTYKDGKVYDATNCYMEIAVKDGKLTNKLYGGLANAVFQKDELPAVVETMIANGEYEEINDMFSASMSVDIDSDDED